MTEEKEKEEKKLLCPRCGEELTKDDWEFCPSCGRLFPLEEFFEDYDVYADEMDE